MLNRLDELLTLKSVDQVVKIAAVVRSATRRRGLPKKTTRRNRSASQNRENQASTGRGELDRQPEEIPDRGHNKVKY